MENVQIKCVDCDCEDQFEYNEDFSFIKCLNCGREYAGGKDEIIQLNWDAIKNDKAIDAIRKASKDILGDFIK